MDDEAAHAGRYHRRVGDSGPAAAPGRGAALAGTDPSGPVDDLEPLRDIVGDARVVALGEGAHFVREFADLRIRMVRFLVERLGFTVCAHESSVVAGIDVDPWVRGRGAGDDLSTLYPDVARWGGRRLLRHLRAHNGRAAVPVRFAGIDVPASGASLLPALTPLREHLTDVDPGLLPLLEAAIGLAGRFAGRSVMTAIPAWWAMDTADRDALTAALVRLRALMRAREADHRARGGGERVDRALLCLDTAIGADQQFGATGALVDAGEQMAAAVTLRDRFMADMVGRRLANADRVVLLAHNVHVQKTALRYAPDAALAMLPMGGHLARELGDGYVAIGTTHTADSVPEVRFGADGAGLATVPLEPPGNTSIEAVLAGNDLPLLLATRGEGDLAGVDRIRAQSAWSYTSVAEAFDAVAAVPSATLDPDVEV